MSKNKSSNGLLSEGAKTRTIFAIPETISKAVTRNELNDSNNSIEVNPIALKMNMEHTKV